MSTAFSEGGWADKRQDNYFSLGWKTMLEGGWTTSWSTAWRWGKETGILPHYYFPGKAWHFTSRKKKTSENHINWRFQHPLPHVRTYIRWTEQTMKFLYGAFSTPHSHLSWAQIFASGSCFQILLGCIPPLMKETMFDIHIAQLAILLFCINREHKYLAIPHPLYLLPKILLMIYYIDLISMRQ